MIGQIMEFLIIFTDSVMPLFLIIGAAFIYNRLMKPDILQITTLTVSLFVPVFVFDELVKSNVTIKMLYKPLLFMVLLTAVLIFAGHLAAKILRANENERVALILACSMINVGNFGLPLIQFTFGPEASLYSVLYFVAFTLSLGTVAVYFCSREKKVAGILKDVGRIPIFHALFLAMIVTGFSIKIPAVIGKTLTLTGQAAIPLMIFILGLQLASIRFRKGYMKFILPSVAARLVLSPVIAFFLLKLIGITGIEKNVAMIQTSTPAALLPLMFAIRFRRSPDLLAVIIVATTLFSGVSLTVLIRLMTM